MSKHTPGPWHATKHTDTKGWTVSAGNSIASVRPCPEVEANARLIAAAPDGYEASKDAADFLLSYFGPVNEVGDHGWSDDEAREVYERLSAAIAKAEGK